MIIVAKRLSASFSAADVISAYYGDSAQPGLRRTLLHGIVPSVTVKADVHQMWNRMLGDLCGRLIARLGDRIRPEG